MAKNVKISSFHNVIGPNGPVPNGLSVSFDDVMRAFASAETSKTIPLGKLKRNPFFDSDPQFEVQHLAVSQMKIADRDSAWVYELCTSQGFLNHTELSQDEFWGSLWNSVPNVAKDFIKAGAMHLVISSLIEDSTPRSMIKILDRLNWDGAPLDNTFLCTAGLHSEKVKKSVFRRTGQRIRSVPYFECNVLHDDRTGIRPARKNPFDSTVRPSKRFVLLNRRINNVPHRIALFLAILEMELQTFGHISMPWRDLSNSSLTLYDRISDLSSFPAGFNRDRLIEFGRTCFKESAKNLPLKLDNDFSNNLKRQFETSDHYSKTIHHFFDDSYFSVIPECRYAFGGEDELDAPAMISEKTFFAMRNFHPFVIMGEPYTLARLRDYGYQTFSSWIDESYDVVLNPADRAIAIAKVIEGLCKMPDAEIRLMVSDMNNTLRHNHSQLKVRVDQSVKNTAMLIEKQLLMR
jgi:hypothetical protein